MKGTQTKKFITATSKYRGKYLPMSINSLPRKLLAACHPRSVRSLVKIFDNKRGSKTLIS
jgi:hypothetical protein